MLLNETSQLKKNRHRAEMPKNKRTC